MAFFSLNTWGVMRILFLAVLLLVLMRWFEWHSLYRPTRRWQDTPDELGFDYEDIELKTSDGIMLSAWWFAAEEPRATVLVCHGNGGNISGRIWMVGDLLRWGYNVLLFDYRGYGRSRGVPTEEGTYRDAEAAYDWIRKRTGEQPIILYGRSLGGAVAAELALRRKSAGVILESTFTSTHDMAALMYPWLPIRWLVAFKYDTAGKVGSIEAPLLISHSPEDALIPYDMGRALHTAARDPEPLADLRGDHNESSWLMSPDYEKMLKAFLRKCVLHQTSFQPTH